MSNGERKGYNVLKEEFPENTVCLKLFQSLKL
jgi:hypothetical protein